MGPLPPPADPQRRQWAASPRPCCAGSGHRGSLGNNFQKRWSGSTRPLRVDVIERRRAGSAHTRDRGRGAIRSAGAERVGAGGGGEGGSSKGGGGAEEPLAAVELRRRSPKPVRS